MLSFIEKDLVNKVISDEVLIERIIVDTFRDLGFESVGDKKSRRYSI